MTHRCPKMSGNTEIEVKPGGGEITVNHAPQINGLGQCPWCGEKLMSDTEARTYQIVEEKDGTYIKCLICGMISYNTHDVEHKYCGNCHKFHDGILVVDDPMAVTDETSPEKRQQLIEWYEKNVKPR